MALCPTVTPPSANVTDGLQVFDVIGDDGMFVGDYTVAGCGTRNFGSGIIKLKSIPPDTTVHRAFLIYNTYQSNNQPVTSNVTLNGDVYTSSTIEGICGSTCWLNPGPELTTYLSNRVYAVEVNITGNGNYSLSGLPVDLAMPISTDGDRLPGCNCSQGAILVVTWTWNDGAGPKNDANKARQITLYVGAKLIAIPTAVWGGSTSYNLNFDPGNFKGNSNIVLGAGDTQTVITGDSININGVQFVPPNNAFIKLGSSFSIRKFSVANIYDSNNSAFVKTNNDCICWFFFGISGDQTDPPAKFQIVSCAATILDVSVDDVDTTVVVNSNNNADPPITGCYAVKGGMFPAAPFYISIDKEIMKVVAKGGDGDDPKNWFVVRGQAGTTATSHTFGACIRLLMPVQSKGAMQAALAKKGQPNQRPNAGQWAGKGQ